MGYSDNILSTALLYAADHMTEFPSENQPPPTPLLFHPELPPPASLELDPLDTSTTSRLVR